MLAISRRGEEFHYIKILLLTNDFLEVNGVFESKFLISEKFNFSSNVTRIILYVHVSAFSMLVYFWKLLQIRLEKEMITEYHVCS